MTIKRHLDDATLMSLSAGTLGEALSAVAAAHIGICSQCRGRLHEMDTIGGVMLANAEPNPLTDPARFLEQVAASCPEVGIAPVSGGLSRTKQLQASDLPAPLSWIVGKNIADIPWKWIGPGVASYAVPLSDNATSDLRLLKVAPNKKLPEHGHSGAELTLIISGAYRDKFGVFGPGDIADMDQDVEHQPIVEPGEDCICVVAFDAPAKFKGPFARILQPLIRM